MIVIKNIVDAGSIAKQLGPGIDLTPEQVQQLILEGIDTLQELIKNDRIDTILQKIENGILKDRYGILKAIIQIVINTVKK